MWGGEREKACMKALREQAQYVCRVRREVQWEKGKRWSWRKVMIWGLYSKGNVNLLRSFKQGHESIQFTFVNNHSGKWTLGVKKECMCWIQLRDYFSDLAQTQLRLRQGWQHRRLRDFNIDKIYLGTSLVTQWLRIHLSMQGTWVRSLAWEDPTCRGATKPVRYNYWACFLEPASHNYCSLYA